MSNTKFTHPELLAHSRRALGFGDHLWPNHQSDIRVAGIRNIPPEVDKLQGIALAGVSQIIISEAGRRTREGHRQKKIADGLRPIVEDILDELDRWFSVSGPPAPASLSLILGPQ